MDNSHDSNEPVAWKTDDIELYVREDKFGLYNIPLYTSPSQRQPLTDERCDDIRRNLSVYVGPLAFDEIRRAIEKAHGITSGAATLGEKK